ncbi:MAG: hypothetical protein LE168_00485 [Endomicrobium sp.]|nr:hypothetical protein [Endomicrobium sp.]
MVISIWEMINTNPVLGAGIGAFYVTYPPWRRPQIFLIEGRHKYGKRILKMNILKFCMTKA